MTSFYVYRSVHHSILIKRLLLVVDAIDRDPQMDNVQREIWSTHPQLECHDQTPPMNWEPMRKRRLKDCKIQRWWSISRESDFPTKQNWYQYQLTERVTACTYLHRFKSTKIPSPRRASWHKFLPLTNNLFAFDTYCQKENQFSSLRCHWFY